tara:strand:- start:1490 stop:1618 length:129 start_codon:yes stop_codon:yes gene_type:complete
MPAIEAALILKNIRMARENSAFIHIKFFGLLACPKGHAKRKA